MKGRANGGVEWPPWRTGATFRMALKQNKRAPTRTPKTNSSSSPTGQLREAGQRHDLRLSNLAIPGHQGHPMDDAGGSDDLVGWIAAEVEVVDTEADLERERPGVDLRQGA